MNNYCLVGDVGATKTELAAYSNEEDIRRYAIKERFPTFEYKSLEQLIAHFLKKNNLTIKKGILAVAGPIVNDKITFSSSNLPWEIDKLNLIKELKVPEILLINDMEAVAAVIPLLTENELYTINRGIKRTNETIAVIAPGTGLGEAFSLWDGEKYQPHVSEGAHVNFGPRTHLEIGLLKHLKKTHKHITYEMICSGMGIPIIYNYLKEVLRIEEPLWISALLEKAEDKTPIILKSALQKDRACPVAEQTLKIFTSVLGAETGNLVLKTMAKGGVFLGGGIPGRIIPFLDSEIFLESFTDKGIMTEMMLEVPIHIITITDSAIVGAANCLFCKNNRISS